MSLHRRALHFHFRNERCQRLPQMSEGLLPVKDQRYAN